MATTLYGNFPLLLPNKTVSVSLYGLQKTSGTILFQPGQDGDALSLAEQEGDVFPDPQVRTTDMGLLEMSFDAYRDTGATSGVFGTEVLNLSKAFETTITQAVGNNPPAPITYNWTITEIWIADSYTERKVLAASLGSAFLLPFPRLLGKRMLERVQTGKRPVGVVASSALSITWDSQVTSVTRRNFGTFDEVDIVTSLAATIA
jgi:hypothetical protein